MTAAAMPRFCGTAKVALQRAYQLAGRLCRRRAGRAAGSVLAALAGGQLLTVTLSHSIFKYDALMQNREKYAQFVLDSIAELWGKMLYSGATSFWETIDGESAFANAGSLCHGWSAIPIYIYFKYFGG